VSFPGLAAGLAGVHLHPRYSEKDVDGVIAAITKVHMALFAPRG